MDEDYFSQTDFRWQRKWQISHFARARCYGWEGSFNEVLDITNDILCPGQSYSKMYGIEPRYNEFFDTTNTIRKSKRKIYLDITNYNVNTRQKINDEQINRDSNLSVNDLLYVIGIDTIALRHQLRGSLCKSGLLDLA